MTASLLTHPGLWLIAAGCAAFFAKGRARGVLVLGAPIAAAALLWMLPEGRGAQGAFLGHDVALLRVDRLARVFATVFALMAFAGGLFALRQDSRLELPAAMVYGGAAIGAVLAGDLLTLFVFWELMAIGSTLVLWSAGGGAAAASRRYLLVHLFGGMLLMAGITGHVAATGSVAFDAMQPDSVAKALILAGFLLNAAAPPFSAWLPDAYPEASWSGMVFLSAFTTKTAVYVLLRGFPGAEILVAVGLFMIFYGIVYAILEDDMRRILAYAIVNQVGFMVTGAGLGTEMAVNGAAAHAFTHIVYKALLLMSAGAVLLQTGRRTCTELGGLFRTMPLTAACGLIGALATSFPLTSGFVSKSMITQAAADQHLAFVWLMLYAGSAGTFLVVGLKFPWFVFFQGDSGLRPAEPPWTMRAAMVFLAFLCVALGVAPGALYALLPHPVDYVPYTAAHVVSQLQLLLFSGLAFVLLLPWLRHPPSITLDLDWAYRRLAPRVARGGAHGARALAGWIRGAAARPAQGLWSLALRLLGPDGFFARPWSIRSAALYLTVLLLAFLGVAYR